MRGRMDVVTELMKQAIAQHAADRYKAIEAECASRTSQRKMLTSFAKQLMGSNEKVSEFTPTLWNAMVEKVSEFTPTLWNAMVEKVTVDVDGIMHFTFKNGTVLCA